MIEIIHHYFPSLKIYGKQIEQLEIYYAYLIEQNQVMNLTAIIDKKEIYLKHFVDSLLILKEYQFTEGLVVSDVGSGAGFPGIVLKIFAPNFKLVIIESNNKKCQFLNKLVLKLKLDNVEIVNARVEEYSHNHNETFDIVLSRAVANLGMLLELTVRLVKINGYLICYKGPNVAEELKNSQKALNEFDLTLEKIQHDSIPELGERNICFFKKIQKTKKIYPRSFSQIKKSPIE